ncbi:hypothetical protein [Collimonas fungivorans]|uniref:hypothetical protein n=1 Tax=Collimonas fungivorans TaxID=158899 RepID=UPI003FA3D3F7
MISGKLASTDSDLVRIENNRIAYWLNRARWHWLKHPYPIIHTGKLAKSKGYEPVIVQATAIQIDEHSYPTAIRFAIRPADGLTIDSITYCVGTAGSGWHLPLDEDFPAIATCRPVRGGFAGGPACELIKLDDVLRLPTGGKNV